MATKQIRALLITDYPLIGNLLSASLVGQTGIEVVGNLSTGDDLSAALETTGANLVLISGHFSSSNALDLVRQMEEYEDLAIVMLGLEDTSAEIMPYIEAGASGYVLKGASVEDLVLAIHAAIEDRAKVSPRFARRLIERVYTLSREYQKLDPDIFDKVHLTPREVEVLELVNAGHTNQEIADRLHVEVGTVKNHVHAILNKLEVNTRGEAARYLAIMRGRDNE